jgi:hypothetical protein
VVGLTHYFLDTLVMLVSVWLTFGVFYLSLWWKRRADWYRSFKARARTPFSLIGFLGLFLVAVPLMVVQAFLVLSFILLLAALAGFLLFYLAVNHVHVRGLGGGLLISGVAVLGVLLSTLFLVPAFGIISYLIGSGLVVISLLLITYGFGRLPAPKAAETS